MYNLLHALNDAEQLELFSLYPKHSEESFSLVSLDGFFHGIVCLPALINPSEWIGDVLPELQNDHKLNRALELTFRYYNQVATSLSEWKATPHFDGTSEQARIWLEGFSRAFSYDPDALEALADAEAEELMDEEDGNMLYTAIIMTFAMNIEDAPPDEDKENFLKLKQSTVDILGKGSLEENKELMVDVVMTVYDLLKTAREQQQRALMRKERFEQGRKMGRNEPCFCGSGKKFKHCHGKPGFKE